MNKRRRRSKITEEQHRNLVQSIYAQHHERPDRTKVSIVLQAFHQTFGTDPNKWPIKMSSSTTQRYFNEAISGHYLGATKQRKNPNESSDFKLKHQSVSLLKLKAHYCPICGTNLDVIQAALEMIENNPMKGIIG